MKTVFRGKYLIAVLIAAAMYWYLHTTDFKVDKKYAGAFSMSALGLAILLAVIVNGLRSSVASNKITVKKINVTQMFNIELTNMQTVIYFCLGLAGLSSVGYIWDVISGKMDAAAIITVVMLTVSVFLVLIMLEETWLFNRAAKMRIESKIKNTKMSDSDLAELILGNKSDKKKDR